MSEDHYDAAAEAEKPEPLDFSHYYSVTASHRKPSSIKQYYKFFQIPGIGQLAGGMLRHYQLTCHGLADCALRSSQCQLLPL
jgi:hypothetical protein